MAYDVFISHAYADKTIADLVCAALEQQGIRCWIAPRDVQPGAAWGEAIVSAIRSSRVVVLVFSDHANTSKHIQREIERAINHEIPILPFRIENVVPSGALEYSLSGVHWLDALTPPVEAHTRRLVQTVRSMLDAETAPRSAEPQPVPTPPSSSRNRVLIAASLLLGMFVLIAIALLRPGRASEGPPNPIVDTPPVRPGPLDQPPQAEPLKTRWEGTWESSRGSVVPSTGELELTGYRVDNPTLLATDQYRFFISSQQPTFRGLSKDNDGSWQTAINGTISLEK